MKKRIVLKSDQELIFDFCTEPFRQEYQIAKGKELRPEDMKAGMNFKKELKRTSKDSTTVRLGDIKLTDYKRPEKYRMEMTTDRMHTVTGVEITKLDNGKLELILEQRKDKVAKDEHGKLVVFEAKEKEGIRPMGPIQQIQFRNLARKVVSDVKKAEKQRIKEEKLVQKYGGYIDDEE